MEKINAKKLKEMFDSGAELLSKNYEYINELNVFPVPDGDTGTNMKITVNGALESTVNYNDDLFTLGKTFARGLLMNARGNSGVIFSQIMKGFVSVIKEGQIDLSISDLIEAFLNAKIMAYRSVTTPVEGTILTVIRVISEKLNEASSNIKTIEELFDLVCKEGKIILDKTPDLLPELKDVGVVDSGGYGLCCFLEGMNKSLNLDSSITKDKEVDNKQQSKQTSIIVPNDNNIGFGYCNEFIMKIGMRVSTEQDEKSKFSIEKLKSQLKEIGDCLVVVHDDDIVKVHVHSLEPYKVLQIGAKYGEFIKVKIENMTLQFLQNNPGTTLEDLVNKQSNKNKLSNETKIIATVPSSNIKEIYANDFKILTCINTEHTGNPSIQEFMNQIKLANSNKLIIVTDDSNVILAAKQAMELVSKKILVDIIACRNILESYFAILGFDPLSEYKTNIKNMSYSLKKSSVGCISISSKMVKYPSLTVRKNDAIGIVNKKILWSNKSTIVVAKELIDYLFSKNKKAKTAYMIYGEQAAIRDIRDIEKYISEKYHIKLEKIDGKQKVYSYYIGLQS